MSKQRPEIRESKKDRLEHGCVVTKSNELVILFGM